MQTLERSYLLRINNRVVERPQHMLMRVAVGIHKHDIPSALATYHLLSERWFTHASPTLFNAGTPRPQLSSCFLVCMKNDSIEARPAPAQPCSDLALAAWPFLFGMVSVWLCPELQGCQLQAQVHQGAQEHCQHWRYSPALLAWP